MTEDFDIEELKDSVSVTEIKKHGFDAPLPNSVEIMPSSDHAGGPALEVIVVFPKGTSDKDIASRKTAQMLSWVQNTILEKAGSGYWPYVFVKTDDGGCQD
jgi:hypothetical protein